MQNDQSSENLTQIALVTGATRGLGYWFARLLARQGYHVLAMGRTQGALEELDDAIKSEGGSCSLIPYDLRDASGLDELGRLLFERFGHLDVLVGNAGLLGGLSPLHHYDPKTVDQVFAVNTIANWRLIRSLDPLLRLSPNGRCVFVSSSVARTARPFWGPYAASKAALESLVQTYALETANTSLRVNLLDPGATYTSMRRQAMPGEDPEHLNKPEDVANAALALLTPSCSDHGQLFRYDNGLLKRKA